MSLRGAVHAFPVETVLQPLADTGKTGRLEVRADERGGTLAMSNGRLVSAWSEDDSGPLALGAIFTIQRGQFEFQSLDRVEGSDLSGELDELLDRAVAERDRVAEIRSIVPDERMRFTLSQRAAGRGGGGAAAGRAPRWPGGRGSPARAGPPRPRRLPTRPRGRGAWRRSRSTR